MFLKKLGWNLFFSVLFRLCGGLMWYFCGLGYMLCLVGVNSMYMFFFCSFLMLFCSVCGYLLKFLFGLNCRWFMKMDVIIGLLCWCVRCIRFRWFLCRLFMVGMKVMWFWLCSWLCNFWIDEMIFICFGGDLIDYVGE